MDFSYLLYKIAIYIYIFGCYNLDMKDEIRQVKFTYRDGTEKSETLMVSMPLPEWAWQRLSYAMESFYKGEKAPSHKAIERFMRNNEFSLSDELMLNPNILLHFSSGYTSIDTVCDILNNGLKCFERNTTLYSNFGKAINESNYVVDTWQIDTRIKYSDFARNSPMYGYGMDVDRDDLQRHYAPAFRTSDHSEIFINDMKKGLIYGYDKIPRDIRRSIDGRALQSIGFIIDGNELDEDKWLDDIYQNPILQQTFCGPALNNTPVKGRYSILQYNNEGKVESLGRYSIASFLYGIPADQILGIVSTYGMLLSDELCKEVFYNGASTRFIVSPTGKLLYMPDNTMSMDDNFKLFLQNRDEFMLENFEGYDKIMGDRPQCKAKGSTWTRESKLSYRALFNQVFGSTSSKVEESESIGNIDDDTMES